MNRANRVAQIERELKALPVGHSKVIEWESVTRWSENVYEIGTWGRLYAQRSFEAATAALTPNGL